MFVTCVGHAGRRPTCQDDVAPVKGFTRNCAALVSSTLSGTATCTLQRSRDMGVPRLVSVSCCHSASGEPLVRLQASGCAVPSRLSCRQLPFQAVLHMETLPVLVTANRLAVVRALAVPCRQVATTTTVSVLQMPEQLRQARTARPSCVQ